MLQAIRDKVTGWIAYGIIFLISVPFALWGVNSYLGGGEAAPAATVNGEEITLSQLDRAYSNYRNRLIQLFGGQIPANFGSEEQLKMQVLEQLVEEFALRQYTDKRRYRISDQDLNRRIQGMEAFQLDGKFDVSVYQAQLGSQGYSPLGFEQELRVTQSMDQLRSGIIASAFIPPSLEKQFVNLSNQSRKVRSLVYKADISTVTVEPAEIEERYNSQSMRYSSPEMVRIDYIELSLEKVRAGIQVDEAELLERYQSSLDAYTSPESRQASHILISVDKDADSETSEQARQLIMQLRQRIVDGESFAKIASEFSQDPGSANEGGDLGDIERGVMVQAFENALFSLQPGELSEAVKTSFGWHLIKLQGISGGEVKPFDSVKQAIENEIRTEMAESRIYDLADNLANLVYEQPDSLLPAAQQLELPVETSDWFERSRGAGIAADAEIRELAFSDEVLRQGLNSEAIELGGDRVVFIRLNQHKPAEVRPLAEVSEQIKTELANIKAEKRASEIGEQAVAALKQGKSLDSLAEEWSAEVLDHGFVSRQQSDVDGNLLARAFAMPHPQQGVVYQGSSQGNGRYQIIELSAVISNDAAVDQQALDQLKNNIAVAEYQSILRLLSSQAEVVKSPLEDL